MLIDASTITHCQLKPTLYHLMLLICCFTYRNLIADEVAI